VPLPNWIAALLGRRPRAETVRARQRGPAYHVVILDGTMSSLRAGHETHAGQLYKLLSEAGVGANLTVYYEPGIQWHGWRGTFDVMQGRGINRQIKRAYGVLARLPGSLICWGWCMQTMRPNGTCNLLIVTIDEGGAGVQQKRFAIGFAMTP